MRLSGLHNRRLRLGGRPAKSVRLYGPDWAPRALRAFKPHYVFDYGNGQLWPSAPDFAASTARLLQGADLKTLTEFAAGAPREDSRGRLIEAKARTRLNTHPLDLGQGAGWSNLTLATLGTPPAPDGGFVPQLIVSGSNPAGVRQSGTTNLDAGTKASVKALYKAGTSGEVRIISRSTSGISYLDGPVDAPLPTNTNNGVFANDRLVTAGALFQSTSTITIAATQVDHRVGIGPSSSSTGDIVAYGLQWVLEDHAGEFLPAALTTTEADIETLALTETGFGLVINHILEGWGSGVTTVVLEQHDDGTANNRVAFEVDCATLALSAVAVVGGAAATLTLGTLTMHQAFQAALSWNADGGFVAQLNGNAVQSGSLAGTMPALTTRRLGKNVTGNEAYLRAKLSAGTELAMTRYELQGVLTAVAGPFDFSLSPMGVATQAAQDRPEKVLGRNYIKDAPSSFQERPLGIDPAPSDSIPVSVDWSLRRFVAHHNGFRAETRLGYRDQYDGEQDAENPFGRPYARSELHSHPSDTPGRIWMGMDVYLRDISHTLPTFEADGETYTSYAQAYLCQLKGSPDPTGRPLFGINVQSDGFRIIIGGGDAVADADGNDRHDFPLPMRLSTGRPYRWLADVTPGVPGASRVRVWLDFELVVDRTDWWVGYPETSSVFYKFGAYVHNNVGDFKADIFNAEWDTDLSWRLTRPRPLPY